MKERGMENKEEKMSVVCGEQQQIPTETGIKDPSRPVYKCKWQKPKWSIYLDRWAMSSFEILFKHIALDVFDFVFSFAHSVSEAHASIAALAHLAASQSIWYSIESIFS